MPLITRAIELRLLDWLDTGRKNREETMPKPKLSPEGEVIAAYGAAVVAAFQVLVNCLEENEAVQPGQFPAALAV